MSYTNRLSDADILRLAISSANKLLEKYSEKQLREFAFDAMVELEVERIEQEIKQTNDGN